MRSKESLGATFMLLERRSIMGYKLVRSAETIDRNPSPDYLIKNYLTKEFNKDFSVAVAELNNNVHSVADSEPYDRVYYCFLGQATFSIDNNTINVAEGDMIFINKNTAYSYLTKEKFKAVLINMPAFGVKKESL